MLLARCLNAFVVVSEIARSHSAKSSTQTYNTNKGQQSASVLTKIATGVALTFGLSGLAGAQTSVEAGGAVLTVRPVVVFTDGALTNTAYGNALKVEAGTGGIARVSGGTFTINPTAPDDDRTGDTAPYAGI